MRTLGVILFTLLFAANMNYKDISAEISIINGEYRSTLINEIEDYNYDDFVKYIQAYYEEKHLEFFKSIGVRLLKVFYNEPSIRICYTKDKVTNFVDLYTFNLLMFTDANQRIHTIHQIKCS